MYYFFFFLILFLIYFSLFFCQELLNGNQKWLSRIQTFRGSLVSSFIPGSVQLFVAVDQQKILRLPRITRVTTFYMHNTYNEANRQRSFHECRERHSYGLIESTKFLVSGNVRRSCLNTRMKGSSIRRHSPETQRKIVATQKALHSRETFSHERHSWAIDITTDSVIN